MLAREELSGVDRAIASLARAESALRLRLGQALEVMGRGGHFELGFSSLGAYALERCERSVRWVEGARCLARRLEALPKLRGAVASGAVSWSMAEVLGRVALPESESAWLEAAQGCTVREMKERLGSRLGTAALTIDGCASNVVAQEVDERCTLTVTLDQEDAWLFEATRTLLEQLGTRDPNEQIEALLAEGQDTLLAALPRGTIDAEAFAEHDDSQQRWNAELERFRARAEALCEERVRRSKRGHGDRAARLDTDVIEAAALGCEALAAMSSRELDAVVRDISRRLAHQELELASGILRLHRGNGWRRLGYATEAQYARERLGISPSSFHARRSLALRLERLPGVAHALGDGIGVEAALQIARVATPATEQAWVARARQRTVKHLREEVAASLVAVRLSGERDCPPPAEEELSEFQNLERAVVSGTAWNPEAVATAEESSSRKASDAPASACAPPPGAMADGKPEQHPAWRRMLSSLTNWLTGGFQRSAGSPRPGGFQTSAGQVGSAGRTTASAGRVTLRLSVARSTFTWWRALEAQARRWLPRGMAWMKFLCLSLWHAWKHTLGTGVAYGHIYVRDRFRCTSPVCNRRDVTPHHLQFRSAGGGDEDSNLSAVCAWCHLCGVHGGRIRAVGTAAHIHWELGPREEPCVIVNGRDRAAA